MQEFLNILFIEDDTIESMKFNRVIKTLNLPHNIKEVRNGEEAIEFLKLKQNLPNIIILDLNMPKLNGIEFLIILKKETDLKSIPAIILTTSNNFKDVKQCYEIGIAGYIIKPLKYEDYVYKIKILIEYWSCNRLISI
ncbi:MAG: response regulator [Flavobacterium sp.]|nr:response regulator [Flavobacterium sp.]